jgi:dTMP kinase
MGTGRYIAFEGAEACGKSTQARLLAADLDAVLTRETGGTRIGAAIREILHDNGNAELADKAETLLIAADRAQHVAEVVAPALSSGRHVVSDRSAYSSLAYQGYGRGMDLDVVRSVNDWALDRTWPELIFLLDVPADVIARRLSGRHLDRFERADDAFHARVREGFARMAASDPEHWLVVDGTASKDTVASLVRGVVRERFGI